MKAQLEAQKIQLEGQVKAQMLQLEYQLKMQLAQLQGQFGIAEQQIESGVRQTADQEAEDRKDDRIKEQASNNPRKVLSSFRTRGQFSYSGSVYSGGRGEYPKDFIATGSVAPMPALRPLEGAFRQSLPQMKSILDVEMRKALQGGLREMQRRARKGLGGGGSAE